MGFGFAAISPIPLRGHGGLVNSEAPKAASSSPQPFSRSTICSATIGYFFSTDLSGVLGHLGEQKCSGHLTADKDVLYVGQATTVNYDALVRCADAGRSQLKTFDV